MPDLRNKLQRVPERVRRALRTNIYFSGQKPAHVHQLTVAEVTTAGKGYPTEVAVGHRGNLPKPSFVQLDSLQTVSKDRFIKYLGALDRATMLEVGRKAVLALGLEDVI